MWTRLNLLEIKRSKNRLKGFSNEKTNLNVAGTGGDQWCFC
jgi:hypothetical protein